MMTCRELNDFLGDYRSDALFPDERARCAAHLARCSHCVASLGSYEATIRLAKGAFSHPDDAMTEDVPDELVAMILAAHLQVQR
jgi:anti-sigma factor RsiW